jgi:hypothetical protein
MSEKKRTTVTIETHEVWIISRVAPEKPDEVVTISLVETAQPEAISTSSDLDNGSEGVEEQES